MAIRLQKVLPFIINEDQTGYIKGRFIGQDIRIIEDVYFTETENLPIIILTVILKKNLIQSTEILSTMLWDYLISNIQSTILNNLYISEWLSPTPGIRQGCPRSAYLFIIAAETLAHKIREDKEIEGIKIGDSIIKINQLADDTTCFLKNHASLTKALHTS